MPRGGKRPNAGRRPSEASVRVTRALVKQVKAQETLDKVAAREVVRGVIGAKLEPLLQAQISNALGIKYLVTRQKKSGKFIRVTEAMARTKLGEDEEIIEVWEKDPSVQAFTDLINRFIDKPKEQEVEVSVTEKPYRWMRDGDEDPT